MTQGVGGNTPEQALATLSDMTAGVHPIPKSEFQARLAEAQRLMAEQDISALYLHAGTSLYYFTGMRWKSSERMVGAILLLSGPPIFIAPAFEKGTLEQFMLIEGEVVTWEEHESPYGLPAQILAAANITSGTIGLDEATPFFVSNGIAKAAPQFNYVNGANVTAACRMIKSEAELALMQRAKEMTLAVHKATASMLREGITTAEVGEFIDTAHRKVGAPKGSYFKIILFGPDSSYPHGVKTPKPLEDGDMVLIDTGCQLHDYISDMRKSKLLTPPK